MTTKAATKVPDMNGLAEVHCSNEECGKFLGYGRIDNGLVTLKCHRCHTTNTIFNFTESVGVIKAQEVRCQKCNRFLASAALPSGMLKLKCRNCGSWNALDSSTGSVTIDLKADKLTKPS